VDHAIQGTGFFDLGPDTRHRHNEVKKKGRKKGIRYSKDDAIPAVGGAALGEENRL
jgi:hypothetical protein